MWYRSSGQVNLQARGCERVVRRAVGRQDDSIRAAQTHDKGHSRTFRPLEHTVLSIFGIPVIDDLEQVSERLLRDPMVYGTDVLHHLWVEHLPQQS